MKVAAASAPRALTSSVGNRSQLRKSFRAGSRWDRPFSDNMDKIAALREILALDAKNSFARYGLAMELAGGGDTDAALAEFDTLLENDPAYTAGYFMAAQTLAKEERIPEAIARLNEGIASARRTNNNHALSEMQGMLDELDR